MRKSALGLCLVAAILVAACSKATDTVIPSDMSAWDKELGPVVQKLGEDEKKNFVAYVARMKLAAGLSGGKTDIPFGTTVGQAIAEQKKWATEYEARQAQEKAEAQKREAEAAALKQKLDAERAAVEKRINEAATVTLVAKRELPPNYDARRFSQYQEIVIGIENKSPKPLKAIAGWLEFIDVFDKVVAKVHFEVSETIKPGATYRWVGGRDFNQFKEDHRALWNLEEGKYKTRFVPETLIFSDGEKLETPKN